MGVIDLFRKESNCEMCSSSIKKKELFGFDSSLRKKRKDGIKMKLCRKCFLSSYEREIKNYQKKAIFFHPIIKYNAYHFYKFEFTYEEAEKHSFIDEYFWMRYYPLLPKVGQVCKRCNRAAQYSYCFNEEKNIDTYNLEKFEIDTINVEHFCPSCLFEKMKDLINSEGLEWYEVFPPVDNDGICISGQV